MNALDKERAKILELDRQILELVQQRNETVSRIGQLKRKEGLPLRDYSREKAVLRHAEQSAQELGCAPTLARSLVAQLVAHALARQEHDEVTLAARGSGQRALVIGGLGKIGAWFQRFLLAQGFHVVIADPNVTDETDISKRHWTDFDLSVFQYIVVAAPLDYCEQVMMELATCKPTGLVFDVASLKDPIKKGLDALSKAGCRTCSVHPMFGPDAELLFGRHVIFMKTGSQADLEAARALFDPTMATCVEMTLEEHDQRIAYVLGLTHLINIAFFTALANSGEQAEKLQRLSSTSFDNQLRGAWRIANENPHLYFDIQRKNRFRHQPRQALQKALETIFDVIERNDEEGFVELMTRGRAYLSKSPAIRFFDQS